MTLKHWRAAAITHVLLCSKRQTQARLHSAARFVERCNVLPHVLQSHGFALPLLMTNCLRARNVRRMMSKLLCGCRRYHARSIKFEAMYNTRTGCRRSSIRAAAQPRCRRRCRICTAIMCVIVQINPAPVVCKRICRRARKACPNRASIRLRATQFVKRVHCTRN